MVSDAPVTNLPSGHSSLVWVKKIFSSHVVASRVTDAPVLDVTLQQRIMLVMIKPLGCCGWSLPNPTATWSAGQVRVDPASMRISWQVFVTMSWGLPLHAGAWRSGHVGPG